MKKVILASLVFGAMTSSALAADAGTGTVKFSGAIITAPCSIAPGDENQNIPLGKISNVTLENGGMSPAQPFNIKLVGCTLNAKYKDSAGEEKTYNNTVGITFTASDWTNGSQRTGLIQITGEGQGAGIKLMTDSGTQVKLNDETVRNFVTGDNTFRFQAALQGVTGTAVTPGKFEATTNFVLNYN